MYTDTYRFFQSYKGLRKIISFKPKEIKKYSIIVTQYSNIVTQSEHLV